MKIKELFKAKYSEIKSRNKSREPMSTKKRLIILCTLLATFLIFFFLRYIPGYSEGYSRTITRFFQVVDGTMFSWIPISIFEIFVIFIVVYIIFWIVTFIITTIKKGFKKSYVKIIDLGVIIAACFTIYAITVAPNYTRDPLDIPVQNELIENTQEYYEIGKYYQNDFNNLADSLQFNNDGSMVNPYTYTELGSILKQEYSKLYSDYFLSYSSTPKPMYLLSWLYSQLQITGVSFPVTGEPNFNIQAPVCDMPFTIAHEMAHTKGVMREEDANLVAAYICLNSDDPYLRYSGYMTTYFSLYSLVQATNNETLYQDFSNNLNKKIIHNIYYVNSFWSNHDLFGSISKFFNDIYLMLSQSNTTDAYVDHSDTSSHTSGGKTIYTVNSYSPYQGLLINNYMSKK